jgi:hypothetical protein
VKCYNGIISVRFADIFYVPLIYTNRRAWTKPGKNLGGTKQKCYSDLARLLLAWMPGAPLRRCLLAAIPAPVRLAWILAASSYRPRAAGVPLPAHPPTAGPLQEPRVEATAVRSGWVGDRRSGAATRDGVAITV